MSSPRFRSLFGRRSSPRIPQRRQQPRTLAVERLDSRELMAAKILAVLDQGVLTITGTEKDDKIEVREDKGRISVNNTKIQIGKKDKSEVDTQLVSAIRIWGQGGNDTITLAKKEKETVPLGATIYGGLGNDTITGGQGVDIIFGEDGNDVITGGLGNDVLDGGAGDDKIQGSAGDDTLTGGPGKNSLDGGIGTDSVSEFGQKLTLTNTSVSGTNITESLTGIERGTLAGTSLDDVLVASDFTGAVRIDGYDGADYLAGGSAADVIYGGGGNDSIFGGLGADSIFGDYGDDWLYGQDGDDSLWGGEGFDRLTGGNGLDLLSGDGGDDFLYDASEQSGNGLSLLGTQTYRDYQRGKFAAAGVGDSRAAQMDDVIQIKSPSCFFAAALAAYARVANPADRIRYLGEDKYGVTLFLPDESSSTASSNYVPTRFTRREFEVTFNGTWDDQTDLAPTDEGDYWPTLFQRAYIAAYGPIATGGDYGRAMMTLTGVGNYDFDGKNPVPGKANTVWSNGLKSPNDPAGDIRRLYNATTSSNFLVVAGTVGDKSNPKKRIIDTDSGLIGNHAYTVVKVEKLNGGTDAWITLRNPWGKDTDYGVKYQDRIDNNFDDGLIRISWSTFSKYFSTYAIGKLS